MTDVANYEAIMGAIKTGIETARSNPGPEDVDSYTAWCILNELRRAGWNITPNTN
jgi:hypothetical protein